MEKLARLHGNDPCVLSMSQYLPDCSISKGVQFDQNNSDKMNGAIVCGFLKVVVLLLAHRHGRCRMS